MMPGPVLRTTRDSRLLVFSQRNVLRPPWHTAQYEFEDLLDEWDDTVLLAPPQAGPPWASSLSRHLVNGAAHRLHLPRRSPPWVMPNVGPSSVVTEHDLFFGVFHHAYQLAFLHRVQGWRERCRRAACLIVELWSPEVEDNADYLQVLSKFDRVFVCNPACVPGLVALGLPAAAFMAPAVDALRFAPRPTAPERVVDCYNYGRSAPSIHADLLRAVEDHGLTYVYDVLDEATVGRPADHRALLSNLMKRSKYFFAFRINDSPERRGRTGGDEVISSRYVEGMAGGAVVLGSPTLSSEFEACFDWPDAVVPLAYDSVDVADVLADFASQEERLSQARTANVRNSLLRHDWVHRWRQVLDAVGMSPTATVDERVARLNERAAQTSLAGDPVPLSRTGAMAGTSRLSGMSRGPTG